MARLLRLLRIWRSNKSSESLSTAHDGDKSPLGRIPTQTKPSLGLSLLTRAVTFSTRNNRAVLLLLALLSMAGLTLVLASERSDPIDGLVDKSSPSFAATERYRQQFGDHAIVILVSGSLSDLVLTDNLNRLLGLEGCLAGKGPPRDGAVLAAPNSPCEQLTRLRPVRAVYGPATFLNQAVLEVQGGLRKRLRRVDDQAREASSTTKSLAQAQGRSELESERLGKSAQQLAYASFTRELLAFGARYGVRLTRIPTLDDPQFVSAIVFDPQRPGGTTPKARFSHLFASPNAALIQIRLRPELTVGQRRQAIELIHAAAAMKEWKLKAGSYTVTGQPIVAEEISGALQSGLLRMLVLAVVVMALSLGCVFRVRRRLVPLAVALGGVAIAYGVFAAAGTPLSLAGVACLPILLGLGVDYAVQLHARVNEERRRTISTRAAIVLCAQCFVPTLATAAVVTAAGFIALLFAPLPLLRQFGLLLGVGVVIVFGTVLVGTSAALSMRLVHPLAWRLRVALAGLTTRSEELIDRLPSLLRLPRKIGQSSWRRWLTLCFNRPKLLLGGAFAAAALGWGLDLATPVNSDVRQLVPSHLSAMRNLDQLTRATGMAGEVDVLVEGDDVGVPRVASWMADYKRSLMESYGYAPVQGCDGVPLCPGPALPDLLGKRAIKDGRRAKRMLAAVPTYFSRGVVTADHKMANMAFGLKMLPLDRQRAVIDRMRSQLRPPAGVSASLAGVPVLVAAANSTLSKPGPRLVLWLGATVAIALILGVLWRRPRNVMIALAPIVVASGWTGLTLAALEVKLTPLSAMLGTLSVAIATEFAVLLVARVEEERAGGHSLVEAIARCYRATGRTVVASAVTVIAGFAVLGFADIELLANFGWVATVSLCVSVIAVFLLLPAAYAVRRPYLLSLERFTRPSSERRRAVRERLAPGRIQRTIGEILWNKKKR